LPGTLDLLILKAASLGERHGYGVLLRLQQMTGQAQTIEQGALYPASYRLERQGLVETEWGTSDPASEAKAPSVLHASCGFYFLILSMAVSTSPSFLYSSP